MKTAAIATIIAVVCCAGMHAGCLIPHDAPQDDPEIVIDDTPPEQLGKIPPPPESSRAAADGSAGATAGVGTNAAPAPAQAQVNASQARSAQASAEVRRLDMERAELEARVAALRKQRESLESEVSGMRSESEQRRDAVAKMDRQAAELQTSIQELEVERTAARGRLNETLASTPAQEAQPHTVDSAANQQVAAAPRRRPVENQSPAAVDRRGARSAPPAVEQPLTSPVDRQLVLLREGRSTTLPNGVQLTLLDDDADTAAGQPGVEVRFDGRRNRILGVGKAVRITAKAGQTIRLTCVENDLPGSSARFEIR